MATPTARLARRPAMLPQTALGLVILGLFALAGYAAWTLLSDDAGTLYMRTGLADMDGDGDLDVVLHRVRREQEFTAYGGATLWINQGHGSFAYSDLQQGGGWASAPADFDGDGDPDLLLYIGYQLRLLVNQGGAQGGQAGQLGLDKAAGPRTPAQFGWLLSGDLDGDGRPDAVVLGCCGRRFPLGKGDDAPNYSQVWRYTGDAQHVLGETLPLPALEGLALGAAALGDLDGDGDLDLFAGVIAPPQGRNDDPADRVLFNDGGGNFVNSGQRLGQADTGAVALGDVDGDGDLDTLVGHELGAALWVNQGGAQNGVAGTFAPSNRALPGEAVTALFLSDLDDDGDLDALVAGRRQATIWRNDGQGAFARSAQSFPTGREYGLAVGDFNGDGLPDVFAANHTDDARLWLNLGHGAFHRPNTQ